ncbi:MAG: glycosyltransferase [Bacteroidetes bacterium]|nr:glycosyltransferase [Bacteroidota bacterium]MBS1939449.1 glycosyltransferase [Bacteroidota bacterium]
MRPDEPILLLCHGFPPVRGIGGRRWAKFAKELARRGHPVHVIRSATAHGAPASLWAGDAVHPLIHHHPLPKRFPSVMSKRPLASLKDKVLYKLWCNILPFLGRGNWLDATLLWRKPLLAEASRLIEQHGIRQVVITGAPFRLMVYGTDLKEQFPQINLVVDFRDEWTWSGHYGLASIRSDRLAFEKQLERSVIHAADKVVAPAASTLDHLRSTYPSIASKYVLLPHPVDQEDLPPLRAAKPGDGFCMIYAGNSYGGAESAVYFNQLLKAFQTAKESAPAAFSQCRLDLYITGQDTRGLEALVRSHGMDTHIRFHAPVPPKQVLKHIANARLVTVFIPKEKKNVWVTKFNELACIGTPVLHIGEPGLVSRTIRERHMGASIMVDEMVAELPRIIAGERKVECDRNVDHSAYLLSNLTDRLLHEVLV